MNNYQNRVLFLRWVAQNFPQVYGDALAQLHQQRSGVGDLISSITDAFNSFAGTVTNLAETYATARAQVDWLKLNAERARNGLPPLDPATGQPVATATLPAPAANSQAAQIEAQLAGAQGPPGWVWIAGAGLVALLLARVL